MDRLGLYQRLEALGERRLAAADRPEEIENLLALLEPLRCVLEIAHDTLNRLFHAEEAGHGGIDLDGAVEEDAAKARVLGRVDDHGISNRRDHAFGRRRRHPRIVAATLEKVVQAHRLAPLARVGRREHAKDIRTSRHVARPSDRPRLRECVRSLDVHVGSPACLVSSSGRINCATQCLTKTLNCSRLKRQKFPVRLSQILRKSTKSMAYTGIRKLCTASTELVVPWLLMRRQPTPPIKVP